MRKFLVLLDKEWRDQRRLIAATAVIALVVITLTNLSGVSTEAWRGALATTGAIPALFATALAADCMAEDQRAGRLATTALLPVPLALVCAAKLTLVTMAILGAATWVAGIQVALLPALTSIEELQNYLRALPALSPAVTLSLALGYCAACVGSIVERGIVAAVLALGSAVPALGFVSWGSGFDNWYGIPFTATPLELSTAGAALAIAWAASSIVAFTTAIRHRLAIRTAIVVSTLALSGALLAVAAWNFAAPLDLGPHGRGMTVTSISRGGASSIVAHVRKRSDPTRSAHWLINTETAQITRLPGWGGSTGDHWRISDDGRELEYRTRFPADDSQPDGQSRWRVSLEDGRLLSLEHEEARVIDPTGQFGKLGGSRSWAMVRANSDRTEVTVRWKGREIERTFPSWGDWDQPWVTGVPGVVVFQDGDGNITRHDMADGSQWVLLPAADGMPQFTWVTNGRETQRAFAVGGAIELIDVEVGAQARLADDPDRIDVSPTDRPGVILFLNEAGALCRRELPSRETTVVFDDGLGEIRFEERYFGPHHATIVRVGEELWMYSSSIDRWTRLRAQTSRGHLRWTTAPGIVLCIDDSGLWIQDAASGEERLLVESAPGARPRFGGTWHGYPNIHMVAVGGSYWIIDVQSRSSHRLPLSSIRALHCYQGARGSPLAVATLSADYIELAHVLLDVRNTALPRVVTAIAYTGGFTELPGGVVATLRPEVHAIDLFSLGGTYLRTLYEPPREDDE